MLRIFRQWVSRVPSPNTSKRPAGVSPRVIVIHSTESHERPGAARAVAQNWFALAKARVSAHYLVDPLEVVQCVPDELAAWHAGKINSVSIGIELCGKAGQSADEWLDEHSKATLGRAAGLVAYLCKLHSIEVRVLTDAELLASLTDPSTTGIVGHVDCSRVLGGTHWDPGPSFPWLDFMIAVRGYLELLDTGAP